MTWEVNAILFSRKDGHVVFDYETAGWSGN